MTRLFLSIVFCCVALAQAPEFEVASVKPAQPQTSGGRTASSGATVNYRNSTLKNLLAIAFQVKTGDQIVGPAWIETYRYDITAKAADGTQNEQVPAMLKALLIERFALKLHTESRDLPAYVLTAPKPSALPKPATGEGRQNDMSITGEHRQAHNTNMASLARLLSFTVQAPVVDKTGLTGYYDFDYPLSREERGNRPDLNEPSIFTIVNDLGLKLEARREPFEVVVIEDGNRVPAEN